MKIYGKVIESGKFVANNEKAFIEAFQKHIGKEIEITIKAYRDTRSVQQNRYYWGVCLKLISESTGYTTDELHHIFKHKYLIDKERARELVDSLIENYLPPRSTTDLDTVEFNNYLEKIKNFASLELGVYIPEPDEITNY